MVSGDRVTLDGDKKQRILDAAAELFAKLGFKKTSVDEIADAAGVGKGTVYLACSSKADLFFQVVHREVRRYVAAVSCEYDPRIAADEQLIRCTAASYRYAEQHPFVRDLLLGNLDEVMPLWLEELEDLRAIGRQTTRDVLALGIRQGLFRTDLDLDAIARMFQDLHAAGLMFAYRRHETIEQQLATGKLALDLLLDGLRTRE